MGVDDLISHLQQFKDSGLSDQFAKALIPMGLEPMTALTDAILAAWTTFWAAFLFCRASGRRPVVLWAWAFVATAVSSLAGVAYHGCRILFSFTGTWIVWKIVPVSTGVAMFCFGCAAAVVWLRPAVRRVAVILLALELAGCLIWAVKSNDFKVVIADSVPVLIALLIGSALHWKDRASPWIAAGVLTSFLAAAVQATELFHLQRLGPLDFNDVFHLIQMVAMVLLYRGGVLLGETRPD